MEHLNQMREIKFRETSADTRQIKYNTKLKKKIVCSKSKEGTAESSGATRFNNTSVDVQEIIVTN